MKISLSTNKVLVEHSHIHLFMYHWWLQSISGVLHKWLRTEPLSQDLYQINLVFREASVPLLPSLPKVVLLNPSFVLFKLEVYSYYLILFFVSLLANNRLLPAFSYVVVIGKMFWKQVEFYRWKLNVLKYCRLSTLTWSEIFF